MRLSPEVNKLLLGLNPAERERVDIAVEALRESKEAFETPFPVFIGGKMIRDRALSHHITIVAELSPTATPTQTQNVLYHLENSFFKADMVYQRKIGGIAQPHFLGPYELTLSLRGKPMHISVGQIDPRVRPELVGRIL